MCYKGQRKELGYWNFVSLSKNTSLLVNQNVKKNREKLLEYYRVKSRAELLKTVLVSQMKKKTFLVH